MPDFYAVPYPTGQDPSVANPRRSRTSEYRHLVADPCKAGKLSVAGYRWAAYLYGGETNVSIRTYATTGRYDSLLSRRQGDCEAFRETLHEEGYNGLPDRDVEYNIAVPHDLLPDYPIGRRISEHHAKVLLQHCPIPRWIDRASPLYRGWALCDETWEGQQSLEDIGLTMETLQEHMTGPDPTSLNPPSPLSHGPSPNHRDRGTPRNINTNMAPPSVTRNQRGQFARQDKEISVTSKEATAAMFAAAALTHLSENPDMYPATWSTGAKTNKAAMLTLANKVAPNPADAEPQSPAEVLRRLNLTPGAPTTPSRKRQKTIDLVDSDEESNAGTVYHTAPRFGPKNPFASTTKKTSKEPKSSAKADPAAVATTLESLEYFKSAGKFMGKFGCATNQVFNPDCPAIRDVDEGRPLTADTNIHVGLERVPASFLHDRYTTACLVPIVLVPGLIKAVDAIRKMDKDSLTTQVPVSFILHAVLRMQQDFGTVMQRDNANGGLDKDATIAAWIAKYSDNLVSGWKDKTMRRVAGLVDYAKHHGMVKCHALADSEVDMVANATTDDTIASVWGDQLLRGVRTRSDDIE